MNDWWNSYWFEIWLGLATGAIKDNPEWNNASDFIEVNPYNCINIGPRT